MNDRALTVTDLAARGVPVGTAPQTHKRQLDLPLPEPGARMKGESRQAYAAFCTYRDLGLTRSFTATWQAVDKSSSLIRDWARRWRWVERANAWDDEVARVKRQAMLKELADMEARHVRIAQRLQHKADEALDKLKVKDMTRVDIIRFIETGTRIEREVRGEPEHDATDAPRTLQFTIRMGEPLQKPALPENAGEVVEGEFTISADDADFDDPE